MANFDGIYYDLKDPEQNRAYHKAYYRTWRVANKERRSEYYRNWCKTNKEKRAVYHREYLIKKQTNAMSDVELKGE